jgi:3-deoxy-D-manno-octulosonate 8-phosphate phosphatase (KDO 8-P phosphatase)
MKPARNDTSLVRRMKKIRLVLMDVDGVLTDGGLVLGTSGQEFKVFHVQDGLGITLGQKTGLKMGILTGRTSEAVTRRAEELHMDICVQGAAQKLDPYEDILKRHGFQDAEVCYIGDDLLDLPVLRRVGFSAAVADAREEVKKVVHYVASCRGGRGAVREVIETILKAQAAWADAVRSIFPDTIRSTKD